MWINENVSEAAAAVLVAAGFRWGPDRPQLSGDGRKLVFSEAERELGERLVFLPLPPWVAAVDDAGGTALVYPESKLVTESEAREAWDKFVTAGPGI